jgi:hypothetical protein
VFVWDSPFGILSTRTHSALYADSQLKSDPVASVLVAVEIQSWEKARNLESGRI